MACLPLLWFIFWINYNRNAKFKIINSIWAIGFLHKHYCLFLLKYCDCFFQNCSIIRNDTIWKNLYLDEGKIVVSFSLLFTFLISSYHKWILYFFPSFEIFLDGIWVLPYFECSWSFSLIYSRYGFEDYFFRATPNPDLLYWTCKENRNFFLWFYHFSSIISLGINLCDCRNFFTCFLWNYHCYSIISNGIMRFIINQSIFLQINLWSHFFIFNTSIRIYCNRNLPYVKMLI